MFDEVQFPTDISEGAVGGPMYNTVVVVGSSGAEQRVSQWQNARLRWDVSQALKGQAQIEELIAFFRARDGKARGFRFKDWTDYRCTDAPLSVSVGATTVQLTKTYASGGVSKVRKITKPVAGTVVIKKNGATLAGCTVDTTTGVVTLPAAAQAGEAYTWSGQFDVPVRFDTDEMRFTAEDALVRSWEAIPLVELL
jgi:uncharacterized protein (TIGR02217 family)